MKRAIRITAVTATMSLFWLAGIGAAHAQQGGTRVAVVNLYVVFKDSVRIKNFKQEMKVKTDPHDKKITEYRKNYEGWTNVYKKETDQTKKDKARKNALAFKRLLEDEVTSVNKILKQHSDRHVVTLYREIEMAVGRVAKTNGIHLVLYYFDPVEESKKYTPANAHRVFASASPNVRASSPIYIAPNLDISGQVLHFLNGQYQPQPISATRPGS